MKTRNTIVMEQIAIMQHQSDERRENAEQRNFYRDRKAEKAGTIRLKRSRASKATRREVYES